MPNLYVPYVYTLSALICSTQLPFKVRKENANASIMKKKAHCQCKYFFLNSYSFIVSQYKLSSSSNMEKNRINIENRNIENRKIYMKLRKYISRKYNCYYHHSFKL